MDYHGGVQSVELTGILSFQIEFERWFGSYIDKTFLGVIKVCTSIFAVWIQSMTNSSIVTTRLRSWKKKDRSINKSKQKYNGKVSNQNRTGIRKEESEDRDVNAKSVWFAAGNVKGCRKKHLGRKYSPTALRRNHSGTEKLWGHLNVVLIKDLYLTCSTAAHKASEMHWRWYNNKQGHFSLNYFDENVMRFEL